MRNKTRWSLDSNVRGSKWHLIAVAAVVGLVLSACASQGGESTTTTDATTTTTSPTTTTTSPTTSTTGGTVDTNDLASGSGCKPGTEDSLPDGEWYGFFADLDAEQIEFDLACWFTGDAAVKAAEEDGEESPPPNDYYVRNVNETVRSLTVSDSATVEYLANGGDPNSVTTTSYAEWHVEWEIDGFSPGYWITVQDGEVTEIVQQYVP